MSGLSRPRRTAAVGVNYTEPGDYPDLSDSDSEDLAHSASSDAEGSVLDSSVVTGDTDTEELVLTLLGSAVPGTSRVSVEGPLCESSSSSEESVLLDSTVVVVPGASVEEPLCGSSPGSEESVLLDSTVVVAPSASVEESLPSSVVVPGLSGAPASVSIGSTVNNTSSESSADEEARRMAASRANQLTAELGAIFFQVEELMEDVAADEISAREVPATCAELKELRVRLVKVSQELNLVSLNRDHVERVDTVLESSKRVLLGLRRKSSSELAAREDAEAVKLRSLA